MAGSERYHGEYFRLIIIFLQTLGQSLHSGSSVERKDAVDVEATHFL